MAGGVRRDANGIIPRPLGLIDSDIGLEIFIESDESSTYLAMISSPDTNFRVTTDPALIPLSINITCSFRELKFVAIQNILIIDRSRQLTHHQ